MRLKNIYFLLFVLLCVQVAFYIYGLIGRAPDIDDAWIGEHAFWMAKDGVVRSELMRGWYLQEERVLIHHKLMTLQGFLVIKVFGFSLYALKSTSLFFFLMFLLVFYWAMVKRDKIMNNQQFIIASLLLFTFHYTFKFSFIFRPEIIIMFLTFISYLLLERIIKGPNKSWHISIIAGLLGGICGVAHLNGIAVMLAGGILLIWNKKWMHVITYTTGAVAGLSLYFYDFTNEYGFQFWKNQLFQSVLGQGTNNENVLWYMTNSLFKEHMRFFHDSSIIGFSILLILILIAGYKYLKRYHGIMLQYNMLLFIIVALLFTQKSRQYILIYLPFFVTYITLVIDKLINNEAGLAIWFYKKQSKVLLSLTLLFFIISNTYFNYKTSRDKFNPEDNRNITRAFIKEDLAQLRIVAPMEFIFDEILYFKSIQGERLYTTLKRVDKSIQKEGFLKKANEFEIDYIILSPNYRKDLLMDNMLQGDTLSGFRVVYYTNKISILKNESSRLDESIAKH